jgi:hypothetical protein
MDLADVTANIRVDFDSRKGSVIDVIRLVNSETSSNQASCTFKRLATELPELAASCCQLRINGKGKLTPCADARTLVEIVWSLPGKAARAFRQTSARAVCRVLGGDLSLVDEIEGRCRALQATDAGRETQDFLVGDGGHQISRELPAELQLASAEQRTTFFENWMRERQLAVADREKAQQLALIKNGYDLLGSLGVADARDRIAFGDLVRRVVQPHAGALVLTQPAGEDDRSVATPLVHDAHRGAEISMHSVAGKVGVLIRAGTEGLIGKSVKALYASRYGAAAAAAIPKRGVPFRGQIFAENTYWERDQDLMEQAIRAVTASSR